MISQPDMIIRDEKNSFYSSSDDFKDFNFDGYADFSIITLQVQELVMRFMTTIYLF